MVLKRNVTANDVWKSLADLFHDNKEVRSMELHEELCSLEIRSLTIAEYFKKIKHVASIIHHTQPPLNLLEARSMLPLEESRLSQKQGRDTTRDTPSSPSVLLVSGSSANKDRPNKELCRNFQRSFCRFGDRCKFIHSRGSPNDKPSQWGSQARSTAP
ncbi:hybrid signal transduction histidine kinase M [Tanacetum coccineum]